MPVLAQSAGNAEQTLTGSVTCAWKVNGWYRCQRGDTPMTCTLACVEHGSSYELVVDGTRGYVLQGDESELARYAGGHASITGVLSNDARSITVEHVAKDRKKTAYSSEEGSAVAPQ